MKNRFSKVRGLFIWKVSQDSPGLIAGRLACWLICGLICGFVTLPLGLAAAAAGYVEGEAIVIFRTGTELEKARQALHGHGAELRHHFGWLSRRGGREMGVVRSTEKTTTQLLAILQSDPLVEKAEPNSIRWPLGSRPTDPRFVELWGLGKIRALDAWGMARPADPVVIAVIDTGVSLHHPDLAPVLWTNLAEIPGNGVDDDTNGYVDDHFSYDFVYRIGDPEPVGDHGTHVSGIAAGAVNNAIGIAGVAREARIMALKVAEESEGMPLSAIVEAIQYATMMKERGVNICAINASYGGDTFSSLEQEAIQAAGNAGIILCAAAGNSASDLGVTPAYPASYRLNNMIVVAASDPEDALASFSSYGATTVDLAAPGVEILSTVVGGLTGWVAQADSVIAGIPMEYSAKSPGIVGTIYDCGLGDVGEFPLAVRSNIALISRGTLTFADKVRNAMDAGARGAIIYNNTAGQLQGTLGDAQNWIPALGIAQAAGLALQNLTPTKGTVAVVTDHERYGYLSGTSMASPHVAGAVAFGAMQYPEETVGQRVSRVLKSAEKLPSLSGKIITGGRLNLSRMMDTDGDTLPDWWELECLGSIAATTQDDPDQDGFPNNQEFIADTHPNSKQSALRLTEIQASNGTVIVRWAGGIASRQYLQRAPTPSGPWTNISTNEPPTSSEGAAEDSSSVGPSFYRLRVERP